MATFRVMLLKTISYVTEVDASDHEEAVIKAVDEAPSLCNQCIGGRRYGKGEMNDDDEWKTREEMPNYDPELDERSAVLIER